VVVNTIVAGNTSDQFGQDAFGPFASLGHNLIGKTDDSSGWTDADLTGKKASPLDPQLGPLQANGGPTQTAALLPGSPALDAGDITYSPGPNDQRGDGFSRIVNGMIDIGAFEVQGGNSAAPPRGTGTRVARLGQNDLALNGIVPQSMWEDISSPTHQLFLAGSSARSQQGFPEQDSRDAFFSLDHGESQYMEPQDLTAFAPGLTIRW
jgi:hypothetical protein